MIKNFTDLEAWKEAHALTLLVYMATKEFPKEESYGLTSQLRRASISVESCIAEGFARYHYKDRVQFYPPSQNTTAVRPWMNAKTSRFGGIPLPTKQWGEDTPTVRSWELHIESRGSICEVESQSITARDLKYLNDLNFQKIYNQAERTAMVLGGLIRSTRKLIIK